MSPVTHATVESLVRNLPEEKLADAYRLLSDLASNEQGGASPREFMRLPLSERRRLMAAQARDLGDYYAETASEREAWQSGDFRDE